MRRSKIKDHRSVFQRSISETSVTKSKTWKNSLNWEDQRSLYDLSEKKRSKNCCWNREDQRSKIKPHPDLLDGNLSVGEEEHVRSVGETLEFK